MTNSELFQILFAPRSIALIGASGDPDKNTSRPQRYLKLHGYPGKVIPINPGRKEISGETAYPNLQAVPGDIDQECPHESSQPLPMAKRMNRQA